uniref:Nostrin n=1 Tax=Strigamia maritima TaxID=126957 RepID=T1JH98_STRMM
MLKNVLRLTGFTGTSPSQSSNPVEDSGMSLFKDSFWGNRGFDELRRYIKQGSDFCKDIASVLQERSELEANYAKGLSKLANKIARSSRDNVGSLAQAWQIASSEMEAEGELHKDLALALVEEVVKPLRLLIENQHKVRKNVDSVVDKNAKTLQDLRNSEIKSKKMCCTNGKECERVQDQVVEARVGKGRIVSDKDVLKLETKLRKTEDAMKKADNEYYALCVNAERARLDWESSVYRGSTSFQALEEERIEHMQEVLQKYTNRLSQVGPKLVEGYSRLNDAANSIDIASDIQTIISQKATGANIPEQILPHFFAEDMSNKMNKDRRRECVEKFLLLLKHDIERERRGKQGVENLARVFQDTPNFADEEAQQDVHEKIQHIKVLLTYLEATRYKLQCSLADIEKRPRPSHFLSKHMEQHKDKQGTMQTILKVPSWVRSERRNSEQGSQCSGSPDIGDRGAGDGTAVINEDYDEFDAYETESIYGNLNTVDIPRSLKKSVGRCKVIYDYTANLHDELSIKQGDLINIHEKVDSDWWKGELNGSIGIFPAIYVEEI